MGIARKPKSKFTRAPGARLSNRSGSPVHSSEVHELRNVRNNLNSACNAAYVAAAALREQITGLDGQVATVLHRCVGDELYLQIERLDAAIAQRDRGAS
jgi:hypothetical protein